MIQGRKFAYSYDNNGNQLTRSQKNGKTWTQAWDAENRLIEVSRTNGADSSVVTFKYDPFGRRIEKQIINSFNGDTISKTVNYVYDAEDNVLQIEEVTHDSTTTTTETRFIHGPGIDEPLAFVRDGQNYFYHADGLGSIVAITDNTQAIAQKYSYESFGLPTPQTTLQQPYMFTGREWDAEIGLYFYRARYYDPMEGRFVSEDPLNFAGGDYNLFNYVSGNPINYYDPFGLFCSCAAPCPSGSYTFTGIEYGGFIGFFGLTAKHLIFKCDGGGDVFILTIQSFNFGGGIGAGVQFPTGKVAGCNIDDVKTNITGWSAFANVFPPVAYLPKKPGFGVGGDIGTNPVAGNSPLPIPSASTSPGYGMEVSAGGSYSWLVE